MNLKYYVKYKEKVLICFVCVFLVHSLKFFGIYSTVLLLKEVKKDFFFIFNVIFESFIYAGFNKYILVYNFHIFY